MAKRIETEQTPTEEAHIPSKNELLKLLRKLKAAESEISESKGRMGSAVESAVASSNVHTGALKIVRRYYQKKSPAQASEFKAHLDSYWEDLDLGAPEADLIESPKERRKRMKKPELEAEQQGENVHALRAAE